ncbi:MAG TPA: TonB family protein [Bacteroidia bacterium]|nr:TonB family protein [Bacteroidia bacterium]
MKKSTSIVVEVPKPCHENWDKMTPNEQGRHCSSCNKTVVDFSKYTDKELFEFLSKIKGSVCGRFNPYQVNRPITVYQSENNSLWQKLMWGTALATSLAACNENRNNQNVVGKICLNDSTKRKSVNNTSPTNNYVSGKITDDHDGKPIAHLRVTIAGTKYTSITDSAGDFKIEMPDSISGREIKLFIEEDKLQKIPLYEFREMVYTINQLPFTVNIKMHSPFNDPPPLTGIIAVNPYPPDGEADTNKVYHLVKDMPKFQKEDIYKYIAERIKYPADMIDKNIQGTVYVNFIVERSGEVSNVKVLRGIPGGSELDSIAVKTIGDMPKWAPGMLNGNPVRVSMNLPIKFILKG